MLSDGDPGPICVSSGILDLRKSSNNTALQYFPSPSPSVFAQSPACVSSLLLNQLNMALSQPSLCQIYSLYPFC